MTAGAIDTEALGSITVTMTIDGAAVAGAATIPVINPATEEVVAQAPRASREQLDAAIAAARRAFPAWRATPLDKRRAAVRAIAEVLRANADELAALLTTEQGKPLAVARGEVDRAAMWAEGIAGIEWDERVAEDTDQHRVVVRRMPLGVVGAIVPWNFPVTLAVWKIAPALLTGNTLVLKPSPNTPLTALRIGELLRNALPAGVLNVISGGDELGPWMTSHPSFDKIAFTGSSATGKKVMASAAEHLTRVTLELGGNDAAVVLPDVDIAEVAPKLYWACFSNSAQYCLATKRLYVHADIYDELAEALAEYGRSVTVGNGMEEGVQLGPIQNRAQYEKVRGFVEESRAAGHRFVLETPVDQERGYFIGPMIVDNPPEDSRIVTEEPFGPVVPMLSFTDADDVIERVNASPYGLGGSVWGTDVEAAVAVAERIESGVVWVNEVQALSPHIPMGGHRESGIGRENGVEGVLEYTATQSLAVRK
ncbi:aldehyde dehydrogenase family protein [Brevibacterium daeguense]|uniref:Aldehyde dehydrogenase family protein n=1 Tax=Brevibacterium daeguense TaxID=909936 RepID=A0ABP8EFF4_9MICO|nr:aldehyde dehydrogenase family protein [Brevibacterium daeguense]